VVEILVFGFEEPIVDFVKLVSENLQRRNRSVRNRVRSEENAILIFVEEFAGLAAQFLGSAFILASTFSRRNSNQQSDGLFWRSCAGPLTRAPSPVSRGFGLRTHDLGRPQVADFIDISSMASPRVVVDNLASPVIKKAIEERRSARSGVISG
jgi:hypothetical protein